MARLQLNSVAAWYLLFGSQLTTKRLGAKVVVEDGGNGAGDKFAAAEQPRAACVAARVQKGSLKVPGFPVGPVAALKSKSCGLNGVTSTNRLLMMPGMRVS